MMIRSLEKPNDEEVKDFWLKPAHRKGQNGSGADLMEAFIDETS
jgi:hypothetical protein